MEKMILAFAIIMFISFMTGLIITIFENKNKKKVKKKSKNKRNKDGIEILEII